MIKEKRICNFQTLNKDYEFGINLPIDKNDNLISLL